MKKMFYWIRLPVACLIMGVIFLGLVLLNILDPQVRELRRLEDAETKQTIASEDGTED